MPKRKQAGQEQMRKHAKLYIECTCGMKDQAYIVPKRDYDKLMAAWKREQGGTK